MQQAASAPAPQPQGGSMLTPTILSVSLLTIMASSAVSPALPEIGRHFAGVDQTLIKLTLTLPSLVVIPFSLLSGALAARFSKRLILFVGLMFYIVAGAGGGLAQNMAQLLTIRAILGIGIGLLMPLSTTLIMDYFAADKRPKMLGLQASVNQFGGMIFLAVSGWLACFSWRYSFGVYLLAVVTLVFIAAWLPKAPPSQAAKKGGVKMPLGVFGLAALGMLMMVVYFVAITDLGLFIQQDTPAFSTHQELFKNREEFAGHLAAGTISATTIDAFAANGITVSPKAKLSQVKEGEEWRIVDGMRRFTVRKHEGSLVVFRSLGTSALVGYALALATLCGIVAGMLLSPLFKALGNFLVPAAALLMAVGFWLIAASSNLPMIFAAMVCLGFSQGWMSPPLMIHISKTVAPQARALAVAVVSSSILFGQFVSPLFTKAVALATGNDTFRFRFYFLAGFLVACAVIGAVALFVKSLGKVKSAEPASAPAKA